MVITLIADVPIRGAKSRPARHLLRRRLNAPWQGVAGHPVLWGLLGLSGLVYEIIVVRRMQRQTAFTPEFENWLFHAPLPS